MGYYDLPADKHPLKEGVRARVNHDVTGRDGGHDIDLRQRAVEGMNFHGRLDTIDDAQLTFKSDLAASLDKADEVSESIKTSIDKHLAAAGLSAPHEARYTHVWQPTEAATSLDLRQANVAAVIWSIGFKSDSSWIDVPVFDGRVYPGHMRGITTAPGLYLVGLPWVYTWGSGQFSGIARDAAYMVDHLVSLRRPRPSRHSPTVRRLVNWDPVRNLWSRIDRENRLERVST